MALVKSTQKNQLNTDLYFSTPVWTIEIPEWVDHVNKVTDKYIKEAYDRDKPKMDERKKWLGRDYWKKAKDHGWSYHSGPIQADPDLKEFWDYVGQTSWNCMDSQGFKLDDYTMFFTECWVQEFSKNGGGHHNSHIHWDNHISGFYYLKCSEYTSFPVFHDPRPGAMMTKLPQKNKSDVTLATEAVHYKPKPGTLVLAPAYLVHEYSMDPGLEPFRFIHFNVQAVRNMIIEGVKNL